MSTTFLSRVRGLAVLAVAAACFLGGVAASASTAVSGTIAGTWTAAGSPYLVTADLNITNLTIQPGVTVAFQGNYEFRVTGVLRAIGTASSLIEFRADTGVTSWKGVFFDNASTDSQFQFCRVRQANNSGIRLRGTALTIRDCVVSGNTSLRRGAGINSDSVLELEGCEISGNTINTDQSSGNGVTGTGGGVYGSGPSLILRRCTISGNRINSEAGGYDAYFAHGAGVCVDGGTAYFENTQFTSNTGFAFGGVLPSGPYMRGGGLFSSGPTTVVNCAFVSNRTDAATPAEGGAVYSTNAFTARNSTFANNAVTTWSGNSYGGAIWSSGTLNLTNCLIIANVAQKVHFGSGFFGGGIYGGTGTITNCTFAYNSPNAVHASSGLAIRNSILWSNDAAIAGDPVVTYSDVQGGYAGTGNINVAPTFVNTTDYRLTATSAGVDAGHPDAAFNDRSFPPSQGAVRNDMGAWGGPAASDGFLNTAPTLGLVPDLTVPRNYGPQTVLLTGISPGNSANGADSGQTVTITASSSHPALIAHPSIDYVPGFSTAFLNFVAAPNQTGVAVITLTLRDNGGTALGGVDTLVRTFTVTVGTADDPARGLVASAVHSGARVGGGGLTGVFVVEGAAGKQVLVRAVGPTLGSFGVPNPLADPQLQIVNASTGVTAASNDDWSTAANSAQVVAAAAQAGAFSLPAGSRDAAVLATFPPGVYRVAVNAPAGTDGVVRLEIYDADVTPRLVYLATRAWVSAGANALTQAFVVNTPPSGRSYLIRALGPSLGVAGALADPIVAIYDAANSSLATNDNWGGGAALVTATTTAGAMPLAPASLDAAVSFTPPAAGTYTVQVSGAAGTGGIALLEIFEVDAQRVAQSAPVIVFPPESVSVAAGQPARFGVVALGRPAPTFQWRKNSAPISGATGTALLLPSVVAGDAGNYDVVITNAAGNVTSAGAALSVAPAGNTATHAVSGPGYRASSTVTIVNTLTYSGTPTSLGVVVTLPSGWSYASSSGNAGEVRPTAGDTLSLSWAWSTIPASPVVFSYEVNVPAGENTTRALSGSAIVRYSDGAAATPFSIAPDPLSIEVVTGHAGDTDRDSRLGLLELTRVIELFNTRNGTVRTGAYAVATSVTEDGFVPDPARTSSSVVTLTRYHSADSNRDGKIGLFELTRVIELFNYRSGTTRTGQYHVQAGTEDGFSPGP